MLSAGWLAGQVDLSSPESVQAFVGRVNANYPRLDVLINK